MTKFERDGKLNFVDKNNVFVGFDYESSCCEHFGHVISRTIPKPGQTESTENIILEDYNFDTDFYFETKSQNYDEENDVVFRAVNSKNEEIYIMLYNHHNGYYAHGFTMTVSGQNLRSGCI